MSPKTFLGAVALALVLFAGTRGEEVEPEVVTAAQVAARDVATTPVVPLEISETTPPPGWTPPAPVQLEPVYPEQEALAWLGQAWDATKWGWLGALVALGIVVVLIWAAEKTRY